MTKPTIEEVLARSAPPSVADVPGVRTQLRRVAMESRALARGSRPRKRVLTLAIPLLFAPVAAFGLAGGLEPRLIPDYVMPISYVTDTGRTVECSIEFYTDESPGAVSNDVVDDNLRTSDWTGIGQRIYDLALDRLAADDPQTNQPSENAAGVITPPTQGQRDQQAWSLAQNQLVTDQIVPRALSADESRAFGVNTDCTPAELH
jgi:hypothetical protein